MISSSEACFKIMIKVLVSFSYYVEIFENYLFTITYVLYQKNSNHGIN